MITRSKKQVKLYSWVLLTCTTPQWNSINEAFSDCWNNKLGIGGDFYCDEIVDFVYEKVRVQGQLLSYEKVNIIVNLMLTKIESDGGFLD